MRHGGRTPVIQVRQRQEDQAIRVTVRYIANLRNSLGYKTSCLKTNQPAGRPEKATLSAAAVSFPALSVIIQFLLQGCHENTEE